ncbi:MAG TPA: hypothetical protein GX523_17305, partial [Desulfitobacterium dehalogenans]|nr:hypothetical protein [Desulfitobacterium dehalogenans]
MGWEKIPAALITQDSKHRLVTDTKIAEWDSKTSGGFVTPAIDISGADLNNIQISGFYRGGALLNSPTGDYWQYVMVITHDKDWVFQEVISYGAGDIPNLIFTRVKQHGAWTPWIELLQKEESLSSRAITDCNLAVTSGFYYTTGEANSPCGDGHLLVMSYSSIWKQQEIWEYNNKGYEGIPGRKFHRYMNNG